MVVHTGSNELFKRTYNKICVSSFNSAHFILLQKCLHHLELGKGRQNETSITQSWCVLKMSIYFKWSKWDTEAVGYDRT